HAKYALVLAGGALLLVLSFSRIELAYVVLLVVAVLARARLSANVWTPTELFVILVVLVRELSGGRRPLLPAFLTIYCGLVLVALADAQPTLPEFRSLARYLLPPLLAIATAAAARDAVVRRRIATVLLVAALVSALPVYIQVLRGASGDHVTGTFGQSQANVL